jgi:hypothetical protein
MPTPQEPDFPPGHPARFDYDPDSPEAQEWARKHVWRPARHAGTRPERDGQAQGTGALGPQQWDVDFDAWLTGD